MLVSSFKSFAEENSLSKITITSINIEVKDIYQTEDAKWFQKFANNYHIKTKNHVVLNALPFKVGDQITQFQLKEAERLLREESYLRDAKLTLSEDGSLDVVVIDKWTFLPTVNFKRHGGENSSALGIRDGNFLGLGIDTVFHYKKDSQKSGYRMRVRAPISSSDHGYVNLVLEEYDAGSQQSFIYEQPFYTLDTDNMFLVAATKSNLETTYYQNDNELGIALADKHLAHFKYGWLDNRYANISERQFLGLFDYSSELIEATLPSFSHYFNLKKQSYGYWAWEQYQSQYQVLENIYITGNKEDINFGTRQNLLVGIGQVSYDIQNNLTETSSVIDSSMLKLGYSAQHGFNLDGMLLFSRLNINLESYAEKQLDDYYTLGYNIDLFKPLTEKVTFYSKTELNYVSEYREIPQSLGGDTNLRGYPTQYQYGKKRWLSSFELRYYSDVELWETFSFAWVSFIDFGRAWDNPSTPNIETEILSSFGIGARIFPMVAGGRNVIHVDIARPFSDNNDLTSWEWRVQVKNSF